MEYACHYCGRTDGKRTRDHKLPKAFGGRGLGIENIVRCCYMCNVIKSARHYGMFVALFAEFLELYGEEYRGLNPDDTHNLRMMSRKFSAWLRAKNAPHHESGSRPVNRQGPRVGPPVRSGEEASER